MHHLTTALAILLTLVGLSSVAQEVPGSTASAPLAVPVKVRKVSVRPSDKAYPEPLYTQGIQGTVEVLAKVGSDGFPSEVSVSKSSRSAALDEAGLSLVKDLRFGSRNASDPRAVPPIVVPVEFLRDSVTTLAKKTCREFNADADYFRATFPEQELKDMPVIPMTIGVLVVAATQRSSGDQLVAISRKVSAAGREIAAACAVAPDAGYLQLFRELAAKSGA